jgi:hypothetical protein
VTPRDVEQFLAKSLPPGERRRPSLTWRGRRLVALRFEQFEKKGQAAKLLSRILQLPGAEHLTRLELVTSGRTRSRERSSEYTTALVKHAPPGLRHLTLDWGGEADLRGVWSAFPELRRLEVSARWFRFGRVAHRQLTAASFVTSGRMPNGVRPRELKELGLAKWPRLERLTIAFGLSALTWLQLRPAHFDRLLSASGATALRRLELRQLVGVTAAVRERLERSHSSRRLKRLVLVDCD